MPSEPSPATNQVADDVTRQPSVAPYNTVSGGGDTTAFDSAGDLSDIQDPATTPAAPDSTPNEVSSEVSTQRRRSARVPRPSERGHYLQEKAATRSSTSRRTVPDVDPAPSSAAISLINMSLFDQIPTALHAEFKLVVETAHLSSTWATCIGLWVQLESLHPTVSFLHLLILNTS